jgi:hypothetical protein
MGSVFADHQAAMSKVYALAMTVLKLSKKRLTLRSAKAYHRISNYNNDFSVATEFCLYYNIS